MLCSCSSVNRPANIGCFTIDSPVHLIPKLFFDFQMHKIHGGFYAAQHSQELFNLLALFQVDNPVLIAGADTEIQFQKSIQQFKQRQAEFFPGKRELHMVF